MRYKTAYISAILALTSVFTVMLCQTALASDSPEETASVRTAVLTVPDANCASTGAETDTLLRGIDGITTVAVDIEKATALISYEPAKTSLEKIKEVLSDAGYPVTAVEELKQ